MKDSGIQVNAEQNIKKNLKSAKFDIDKPKLLKKNKSMDLSTSYQQGRNIGNQQERKLPKHLQYVESKIKTDVERHKEQSFYLRQSRGSQEKSSHIYT
jgi:hypothetical protein